MMSFEQNLAMSYKISAATTINWANERSVIFALVWGGVFLDGLQVPIPTTIIASYVVDDTIAPVCALFANIVPSWKLSVVSSNGSNTSSITTPSSSLMTCSIVQCEVRSWLVILVEFNNSSLDSTLFPLFCNLSGLVAEYTQPYVINNAGVLVSYMDYQQGQLPYTSQLHGYADLAQVHWKQPKLPSNNCANNTATSDGIILQLQNIGELSGTFSIVMTCPSLTISTDLTSIIIDAGGTKSISVVLWIPTSIQTLPFYTHMCSISTAIVGQPLWNASYLNCNCLVGINTWYNSFLFINQTSTTTTVTTLKTTTAQTTPLLGSSVSSSSFLNSNIAVVIAIIVLGAISVLSLLVVLIRKMRRVDAVPRQLLPNTSYHHMEINPEDLPRLAHVRFAGDMASLPYLRQRNQKDQWYQPASAWSGLSLTGQELYQEGSMIDVTINDIQRVFLGRSRELIVHTSSDKMYVLDASENSPDTEAMYASIYELLDHHSLEPDPSADTYVEVDSNFTTYIETQ